MSEHVIEKKGKQQILSSPAGKRITLNLFCPFMVSLEKNSESWKCSSCRFPEPRTRAFRFCRAGFAPRPARCPRLVRRRDSWEYA